MKYRAKVNCFHSNNVERFDADHVYDIDDKKMKAFKDIGFDKYFEPLSPAELAETKKEDAK